MSKPIPFFNVVLSLKPLAALFLILSFSTSQAQYGIRDYAFTKTSGTFTAVTGGINLGDPTCDDQLFNDDTAGITVVSTGDGFPIGFTFNYGGVDFSSFAVSNNGFIKLGNGTFTIRSSTTASFSTPADSADQKFLIAGLHLDLKNKANSSLSFQTVGTSGNRELIVQWKDFKSYLAGDAENYTFQIRLKENGNIVSIVYDNFTKDATDRVVTVGLKGGLYNDVHTRKIAEADGDTWETSNKSLLVDAKADLKTNFKPAGGLSYTFSPPVPTPDDAGVTAVLVRSGLTSGCPSTNAESIRLVLKNYGTASRDSLRYRVFLNGALVANNVKQYSPALSSGGRDTLVLPQTLDMLAANTYTIKATTVLANDTGVYMSNDTAQYSFTNLGAQTVPFQTIRNFNQFGNRGWKQYKGTPKPQTPGGDFAAGTIFSNPTTSIYQSAFATIERKDWMVSSTYAPKPNMILKFRAAITGFDSITPMAGIGDDEFKIMVSTDCGATWTSLKVFNNASVTSGEINNTRKGFQVSLATINVPFQVAYFAADKNTVAPESYYFHLDDVVIGQGNALDMACLGIVVENETNPGCNLATFPVKVKVKNVGDSAVGSYVVSVRVNSNTPVTQTITPTPKLAQGDSAEITFPSIAITPNNSYKVLASTQATLEDGYSSANDTASTSFVYLGSTTPLTLPASLNFNGLPTGLPTGWLVDQGSSLDFRVRSRSVLTSKTLSANFTANNPSSFAIMPVTLPLPANYMFNFDLRVSNDFGGGFTMGAEDSILVTVSDNCGGNFNTLFRVDAANPLGFNAFANATVDLSAYANKSVSIRFTARIKRTDFAGAWVDVDNIGISPNTGISTILEESQFSVFPNPGRGKIFFKVEDGETFKYQVTDASGRLVKTGSLSQPSEVDFTEAGPGIYFVQATNQKGVVRKKLVIY